MNCHTFRFYLVLIVPFLALASVQAQTSSVAKASSKPAITSTLLPTDPAVLIGKLPNGLTYYIRKNSEPENRATLYLVNKVGSVLENDDQQGLAHFLEHMAFNGTRDFPKNELVNYLQKAGVKFGADLNAYTSFDETVYQLPIPVDNPVFFEKGFDILANWAGMISLDRDEVDAERGIILEEERAHGKNAQDRMQKQTLPILLNHSRYAQRLPIGKEEILKTFQLATIKQFYQNWYRPDLQAVIAVGDFDPKQVEQFIKAKFSGLKNPAVEIPRPKYTIPTSNTTRIKIITDKECPYTSASIMVMHPKQATKTKEDYAQRIKNSLFNYMLSSRLAELSQEPNPPFLQGGSSYEGMMANLDAFTSSVTAKPGELETAIKAIVNQNEKVRQFGFTATELARAKLALMNSLEEQWKERDKIQSSELVEAYVVHFTQQEAIPGIKYEYELYKKILPGVTLTQLNTLARQYMGGEDRVILVQAPDKDKATLPTESTLLQWINGAGKGVTAYVDQVSNQPLMKKSQLPTGSKIISEKKDPLIGTTELALANGVHVVLKPTKFKNDEIQINGYRLGGISLASDNDFHSANFASSVIPSSGVGAFGPSQLDKFLTGKSAYVFPFINELTEGISGGASPKDLETAMQLIYLYFTAPRKDVDVWNTTIDQTKASLANQELSPESIFSDTLTAVASNHHPRRMPFTLQKLDSVSLDQAFAFYQDRFADASGFTFVLVGNFETEKIKPLLEKYLGGLPSTKRQESYKDLGIRAPAGQLTKTVYRGIENKSLVNLVFSGDYQFNEGNNLQMSALEEIVNIKLTERLREKEGGVYSPSVQISYQKIPVGRYACTISFNCASENVDKLIAATLDEVNKLKQHGADAGDIEKFVSEEKRATELQLKNNGFWLSYLTYQYQLNENPQAILERTKQLNSITPASTKAAANQYLSGTNLMRFILRPEQKQ